MSTTVPDAPPSRPDSPTLYGLDPATFASITNLANNNNANLSPSISSTGAPSVPDPTLVVMELLREVLSTSKIQQQERDRQQQQITRDVDMLRSLVMDSNRPAPPTTAFNMFYDSPYPDRSKTNRRSSANMFGSPAPAQDPSTARRDMVLQSDVQYSTQMKVCSMEGLRFLSHLIQSLKNQYPGRDIKSTHLIATPIRIAIVAYWNLHCFQFTKLSGQPVEEVLIEDWYSLTNDQVHAMLLETARPRTTEQYAKELVLFLGKNIPQSPVLNVDNFATTYFQPLMQSLQNLAYIQGLLSPETSNFSSNVHKMPVPGYGTREHPGHVQLWLFSLGTHCNAVLQWLTKKRLTSQDSLESIITYIRHKLMEVKSQSDMRDDLAARLTPIRYEDLRKTQGESYARLQSSFPPKSATSSSLRPFENARPRDTPHSSNPARNTFAAISTDLPLAHSPDFPSDPLDPDASPLDFLDGTAMDEDDEFLEEYMDSHIPRHMLPSSHELDDDPDLILAAVTDPPPVRTSIASAFRGYCSSLFVTGACTRQPGDCTYDHSAEGLARCTQSFLLLSQRDLAQHAQLPPPLPVPSRPPRLPEVHRPASVPANSRPTKLPAYQPPPSARPYGASTILRSPHR
jgi:hypothetical protein